MNVEMKENVRKLKQNLKELCATEKPFIHHLNSYCRGIEMLLFYARKDYLPASKLAIIWMDEISNLTKKSLANKLEKYYSQRIFTAITKYFTECLSLHITKFKCCRHLIVSWECLMEIIPKTAVKKAFTDNETKLRQCIRIMDLIGDFMIQQKLLEIIRLYVQSNYNRQALNEWFFKALNMPKGLFIANKSINLFYRKIINAINEVSHTPKVYSIEAKRGYFNRNEVLKSVVIDFWIDFNFARRSISFFIEPIMTSKTDDLIFCELRINNISNVSVNRLNNDETKFIMQLKGKLIFPDDSVGTNFYNAKEIRDVTFVFSKEQIQGLVHRKNFNEQLAKFPDQSDQLFQLLKMLCTTSKAIQERNIIIEKTIQSEIDNDEESYQASDLRQENTDIEVVKQTTDLVCNQNEANQITEKQSTTKDVNSEKDFFSSDDALNEAFNLYKENGGLHGFQRKLTQMTEKEKNTRETRKLHNSLQKISQMVDSATTKFWKNPQSPDPNHDPYEFTANKPSNNQPPLTTQKPKKKPIRNVTRNKTVSVETHVQSTLSTRVIRRRKPVNYVENEEPTVNKKIPKSTKNLCYRNSNPNSNMPYKTSTFSRNFDALFMDMNMDNLMQNNTKNTNKNQSHQSAEKSKQNNQKDNEKTINKPQLNVNSDKDSHSVDNIDAPRFNASANVIPSIESSINDHTQIFVPETVNREQENHQTNPLLLNQPKKRIGDYTSTPKKIPKLIVDTTRNIMSEKRSLSIRISLDRIIENEESLMNPVSSGHFSVGNLTSEPRTPFTELQPNIMHNPMTEPRKLDKIAEPRNNLADNNTMEIIETEFPETCDSMLQKYCKQMCETFNVANGGFQRTVQEENLEFQHQINTDIKKFELNMQKRSGDYQKAQETAEILEQQLEHCRKFQLQNLVDSKNAATSMLNDFTEKVNKRLQWQQDNKKIFEEITQSYLPKCSKIDDELWNRYIQDVSRKALNHVITSTTTK